MTDDEQASRMLRPLMEFCEAMMSTNPEAPDFGPEAWTEDEGREYYAKRDTKGPPSALDVLSIRSSLEAAMEALQSVRNAVDDGDLPSVIMDKIGDAESMIECARHRLLTA